MITSVISSTRSIALPVPQAASKPPVSAVGVSKRAGTGYDAEASAIHAKAFTAARAEIARIALDASPSGAQPTDRKALASSFADAYERDTGQLAERAGKELTPEEMKRAEQARAEAERKASEKSSYGKVFSRIIEAISFVSLLIAIAGALSENGSNGAASGASREPATPAR